VTNATVKTAVQASGVHATSTAGTSGTWAYGESRVSQSGKRRTVPSQPTTKQKASTAQVAGAIRGSQPVSAMPAPASVSVAGR
jgi:hypothetical protein